MIAMSSVLPAEPTRKSLRARIHDDRQPSPPTSGHGQLPATRGRSNIIPSTTHTTTVPVRRLVFELLPALERGSKRVVISGSWGFQPERRTTCGALRVLSDSTSI